MHFRIQLLRNSARKEAFELPALLGKAGKVLLLFHEINSSLPLFLPCPGRVGLKEFGRYDMSKVSSIR